MDFPDVAEQAINLFLEYRDVHGFPEKEAKEKAVYEFQEYESLCVDEKESADAPDKANVDGCTMCGVWHESGEVCEICETPPPRR